MPKCFPFRLEAEVRAGCIDEDDAELADQVRQQGEALDATKKVMMMNALADDLHRRKELDLGCVIPLPGFLLCPRGRVHAT